MSFLIRPLVTAFLAEKAFHLVSNEINNEIQIRKTRPVHHRQVDFALFFSGKSEQNTFLDLCNSTSITRGNGITFYQTTIHEKTVIFVDVASDPIKITEVVLDIFQPKRVISAGFAKSLHKNMKNRLLIPTRIVTSQLEGCLEIWNPSLIEGPEIKSDLPEKSLQNNDFCSGTLCSGIPTKSISDRYAPFAVDSVTYFVVETCRRRSVPVFPLAAIISQHDPKNDIFGHHGIARKFGLFLNQTWKNPKFALNSFAQQIDSLETGDVLAKTIIKLFFQNSSSEAKCADV